jgi:hypothetical protein
MWKVLAGIGSLLVAYLVLFGLLWVCVRVIRHAWKGPLCVALLLCAAACGGGATPQGPDVLRPCASDATCAAGLSCVPIGSVRACVEVLAASATCPPGYGEMFTTVTSTDYPSGAQTSSTVLFCVPTCETDSDCPWRTSCWHGLCSP